jgi:TPR repeat protein
MRREDIDLRQAARAGEPQACMEMARRLLQGDAGFARNPTLGLGYLQQQLARGKPDALHLVAREVPLEVIVAHRLQSALAHGVEEDCPASLLKLGVLYALDRARRAEALPLLRLSAYFGGRLSPELLERPAAFAEAIAGVPRVLLDPVALALLRGREALQADDLATACYCIELAATLSDSDELADLTLRSVRLAATAGQRFELPVAIVEAALRSRSRKGEAEAQYALGCALAGLRYGHLEPHQIARQRCTNRATGWLLRAADAGRHAAWLDLFHLAPETRAMLAGQDVARFFLEKAARSGMVEAQTRLGTLLLAEATCLRTAEDALHWLASACDAGAADAATVLRTLVLPLPALPPDYEQQVLERVATLDRDLAMRLTLARALHLTRHEALGFNAARDLRAWGLVLPGSSKENPKGRLAPAVDAAMKSALQQARAFYAGSSPLDGTLAPQRTRALKRVFELLALSGANFFADSIGRSWTHYGYGRHWAARGKKPESPETPFLAPIAGLSP